MLFFGHIGITVFIGLLLFLSPAITIMGALLPDIVDKGLLVTGISNYTRLFAHNVFFGPIISSIVYIITKRKDIALAIFFGTYMHLIEDIRNPLPWFWPFVNYEFGLVSEIKISLDVLEIFTEFLGLSLLILSFAARKEIIYIRGKLLSGIKGLYDRRIAEEI